MKDGKIHFYELDRLPDNPKPFTVYYIKNGVFTDAFVTDYYAKPTPMGNVEMIQAVVNAMSFTPVVVDGISVAKARNISALRL